METEQQNNELTPSQVAGLQALLTSPTQEAAARKAGVDPSTLRRWMKEPAFITAYREARQTLIDSALTGLLAISSEAIERLYDEIRNDKAKPAERISAIRAVLEFSLKTQEQIITDERLAVIEMALASIKEAKKQ